MMEMMVDESQVNRPNTQTQSHSHLLISSNLLEYEWREEDADTANNKNKREMRRQQRIKREDTKYNNNNTK